jgi:sucrose-6F-phosphate phosphohydrolase
MPVVSDVQRLLATDLDGTFIGDDEAMVRLWADLDAAGVTVAFSTGRHLPSIWSFYDRVGTDRRAEACICMVGTEIWHLDDDGYRRDRGWSEHISVGWDHDAVVAIASSIPGSRLQDDEWQSEFKSSWFLDGAAPRVIDGIRDRIASAGLEAKVVYSVDRFLDFLPGRSGKGEAVRYLADTYGVDPADVVTSGDSGNDLDMMRTELGFRCIAVGNASEELRTVDRPNVFHASAEYASGIREGLEHYGWLVPDDPAAR